MSQSISVVRLAGYIRESIVDGPGLRFTIFTQGCPHNCKGCHNPDTHDFGSGFDCDISKLEAEIKKNPLLSGVTFSGGEPFCQSAPLAELGKAIKSSGLNIIVYSGFTFEELDEKSKSDNGIDELLKVSDFLIDGRFILSERDLRLRFRGSRNQRIIDLKESLKNGLPVVCEL